MNNIQLAIKYFESVMKRPLDQIKPIPTAGGKVAEILWPLNDIFRPKSAQIRSIKYDPKHEAAADEAIEKYVKDPQPSTWENLHGDVWRVLLERHEQLIIVAMANERAGNHLTNLPEGLPVQAQLCGIMLLLLHSMVLPWQPEDRSGSELPAGSLPTSLTQH